jgi:hypothetical protein
MDLAILARNRKVAPGEMGNRKTVDKARMWKYCPGKGEASRE